MLAVPPMLQARSSVFHRHFAQLDHPLRPSVEKLLIVSDYACRHIDILRALLARDDCQLPIAGEEYIRLLANLVINPPPQIGCVLRYFRHYHLLRLLLRGLHGLANTQDSMTAWSDCADAIILQALELCEETLSARYGIACEASGAPARLYVLAMGKLGGRELNYSSDIDLIMGYSAAGFTNGQESIPNEQYYTRVVQLFIQLLQRVTAEGFVFRVDLRLRPNGESGALVSSLAAMETYYQEQGRDWERYAMVKSRLINESTTAPGHWFHRLIIPFVYRRYVDFSVIESLRSMKAMIAREVLLNPRLDDIKRGLGGIREVEFIIQHVQLIRGGRLIILRQQNALMALEAIYHEQLLPRNVPLKKAYLFLRQLENCLQSENDQQTHSLPLDKTKQAEITYAMGFASWEAMTEKLQKYQRLITGMFQLILRKVDYYEDNERVLINQLTSVWQGHVEQSMAVNLLQSLGFEQAERCYQLIHAFRHGPRCRRLNQTSRLRLDRFMVLLLSALQQVAQTDALLLQVIHLLDSIVGRSAYLALLTENPQALKELLHWFAHSAFITSLIVGHPFLLELLLSEEKHWRPQRRHQLALQLANQLDHCTELELQQDILRQFKLSNWLLVARAEMRGTVDAVRAGQFLADVAEVIVSAVVTCACQQLVDRYPHIKLIESQFAIIAYGKAGSREMNYHSDLDLVFIHSTQCNDDGLLIRLTQKIIHMLTMRLQSGILYQVDTRLRPSGEAGLLVSPLSAFVDYQKTQAWTWEHQALIRTRVMVGGQRIRRVFQQLKKDVLSVNRSKADVSQEVQAMREKMSQIPRTHDVKQAPGGLLDLEFLVQFLVLVNPGINASRHTHTLHLLTQLTKGEVITAAQSKALKQAFRHYHHLLHHHALQSNPTLPWAVEQAAVLSISQCLW